MDLHTGPTPQWPLSAWVAMLALCLAIAGALWAALRQRQRSRALTESLDNATSQLDEIGQRDALTGLASRPQFEQQLDEAADECDAHGGKLALLYLNLDDFRLVNDAFGHAAGDDVLRHVATRLGGALHGTPRLARIAGDEFVIALRGGESEGRDTAARLLAALREPLPAGGTEVRLDASIGIACYPAHGTRQRLLMLAGTAMRSVKQAGGSAFAVFEPSMGADMRQQAEMLRDLRLALERHEFELLYQPKIDTESLQVTAAEALLRWRHPVRGIVSPAVFVPLLERHGLIAPIGRWVIEEACRQAAAWREQGLRMRVAVNISGHQLRQDDFADHVQQCLQRHAVSPARFTCEITETVAMEDTRVTHEAFERLRRLGVHVSIDDFGTGHSSLARLRALPAAELKVDRAFITDLATSREARSIVASIVTMAHELGLRVVAEGVETARQCEVLAQLECDEQQGYLFAKPMSATALALWAIDGSGPTATRFRDSLFRDTLPRPLTADG